MNECVDIIKVAGGRPFAQSLDDLKALLGEWLGSRGLTTDNLIWSRAYLTDPSNQLGELMGHSLYADMLSRAAFSHVGQSMLDGSKVALVFAVSLDAPVAKQGSPDKMTADYGGTQVMLQSVRLTDAEVEGLSAQQQTELIFSRHIEWLRANGMTLKDHCMRTWLYVRDIDRNYAGVMKGRNAVFAREGLTADTHYIASTGIEGCMAETQPVIAIDFFSVKQNGATHAAATTAASAHETTAATSATTAATPATTAAATSAPAPFFLNALDYLNRTSEYGVAFERGTKVSIAGRDKVFISGTASIDKFGNCLYVGDVVRQTDRLFLNISQLLANAGRTLGDMTYMIVYLRDIADAAFVEGYLKSHFPSVPHLVVKASVCRPKWLIEVECVTK